MSAAPSAPNLPPRHGTAPAAKKALRASSAPTAVRKGSDPFWLTYLFTAAAFGVQAYVFKLSFEKEAGAKSKFYGFPIARVGVLYLAVQIMLGLVFMALAAVAPVWLALVLYLALLAAAAVGVFAKVSILD